MMVVEKWGKGFEKFAVIIESAEELAVLYAGLNAPPNELQEWSGERWPTEIDANVAYKMYDALYEYRMQEGI